MTFVKYTEEDRYRRSFLPLLHNAESHAIHAVSKMTDAEIAARPKKAMREARAALREALEWLELAIGEV
jgi:hypothetical protein